MQIIDKYGYLENALNHIEGRIASGRGLQKIVKKVKINEDLIENLSLALRDFSEKRFFAVFQEKIENEYNFTSESDVEISGADISIETQKGKAFLSLNLYCDIVIDGEQEDKIKMDVKIFSKDNIKIIC